jgi:PLP dependent protein
MSIKQGLDIIKKELESSSAKLIAVSKTKPISAVLEAYELGHRDFGENKVQEMCEKAEALPRDIKWHLIGHLQRNKVKYIAPFVYLIHSVDSLKLLAEINKQAEKNERVINVLLQIFIAKEESKFGLDKAELHDLLSSEEFRAMQHIKIIGLMGMASFTDDKKQIEEEFTGLKHLYDEVKDKYQAENISWSELSMGMSGDYPLAVAAGSTYIRVGSVIFGNRNYE